MRSSSLRITGGRAGGLPLVGPGTPASRPTTDFLRARVFNILANDLGGAHVCDGFAGVGTYGLEALSRGAHRVDFVENNRRVIASLQINIGRVTRCLNSSPSDLQVIRKNIFRIESLTPYTHFFLDPPYPFWESHYKALCALLKRLAVQNPHARLILEKPKTLEICPEDVGWRTVTAGGSSDSIGIFHPIFVP